MSIPTTISCPNPECGDRKTVYVNNDSDSYALTCDKCYKPYWVEIEFQMPKVTTTILEKPKEKP